MSCDDFQETTRNLINTNIKHALTLDAQVTQIPIAYLSNIEYTHAAPNGAVEGKLLSRHMYIWGRIRIDGDSDNSGVRDPVKFLMDSGATTRNFIDEHLIDSDPRLMSLVRFEKTKVILGDGNDKQAIDCHGVITIDVNFEDDKGVVTSIKKLKCIIMPTLSVSVIIGLVDIVHKIPKLFMKGLVAAINEAHEGKLDAMCSICSNPSKKKSNKSSPTDLKPTITPVDPVRNSTIIQDGPNSETAVNNLTTVVPSPVHNPVTTAADGTTPLAADGVPRRTILKIPRQVTTDIITVITINVNGLKGVTTSGALQQYILSQPNFGSTVFLLQETKISHAAEIIYTDLFLKLGFTQVAFNSRGNKGGVAILSSLVESFVPLTDMARRDDDNEARVAAAAFEEFTLNCVYKPYLNKDRDQYCKLFAADFNRHIGDQIDSGRRHIIVAGDVNVAPTRLDETTNADPNGPCSTQDERQQHADLLKLGLRDAYRETHKNDMDYTVSSNVAEWKISKSNDKSEMVDKRIDVILVSNKVKVISSAIDHSTRSFTDHSAVIATLDVSKPRIQPQINSKNSKRNAAHQRRRTINNNMNVLVVSNDEPKCAVTVEDVEEDEDSDAPWGYVEQDGETIPASAPWWKQRADHAKQRKAKDTLLKDIKNTIQYNEVHAFLNVMEEIDMPSLQETVVNRLMEIPAIEQMISSFIDSPNFFKNEEGGDSDAPALLNATTADADKIVHEFLQGNIEPPWEKPPRTAPEDENISPPGLFGEFMDRMQHKSYSDSEKEFLAQIPSQVQEKLLEDPKWLEMLFSKGLEVWGTPVTTGISGLEPLELQVNVDAMPAEHRAQLRPPPQQIRQEVREYIASLIGTMFERSDSSITSPMTVATKKTPPYFRLAGDYRWLNQFILMVQSYVPVIMDELYRAKGWRYFADIDWRAAFHQIPLSKRTSKLMTLMTVLGPLRPKFMMEGVNLASNVLQNVVAEIFDPLREDGIFMFDNVLMGAATSDELFDKVNRFLDICIARNIKMNFTKTWIGFNKATFFGYVLDEHGYRLDESRKRAITEIPMPGWGKNKKENNTQMKSFLGFSVYFIPFVENFAKQAAPLHDMTHDDFSWDKSTWTRDYEADFKSFKSTLATAMDLVFPDFDLEWIFLPDASEFACGWIILQLRPMPDGTLRPEPISVGSEKFSTTAIDWPINEKEAYAMVRGMKVNQGILRGKPFLVATDHWNLTFIERDPSSKMQRYLMSMQMMPIKGCLKINGKDNPADYPSRWHPPPVKVDPLLPEEPLQSFSEREYDNASFHGKFDAANATRSHYISLAETMFELNAQTEVDADADVTADDTPSGELNSEPSKHRPKTVKYSPEAKLKIFKACHGGTAGCWGIRRTYRDIMKFYPGNNLSYRDIYDMVQSCPDCQKRRVTLPGDRKTPQQRVIGPFGPHECVSIDGAPISVPGPDINGCNGFNLVKNMGMGYIAFFPYKNRTIEEAVDALLLARLRIGHFSILLSDPGSDYTGKLMKSFNSLIDVQHRLTLVNRPQASGIEPDIKEAKRFLTAIAEHLGLRNSWSSPRVIAIAEFLINSDPDEDSGISPYEMMHGRRDHRVFEIFAKEKKDLPHDFDKQAYLKVLQEEFKTVESIWLKCKRERAERITRNNLNIPQNKYQLGDLIFYIIDKRDKDNSFQSVKMGPFEVIKQTRNDVTYKSLITGAVKTCDVSDTALFMGSKEDAYRLALTDQNQVVITSIDAWRGNPDLRTSCKFLTTFDDGSRAWQSFNSIKDTVQLEQLCESDPRLCELTDTTQVRDAKIKKLRTTPVPVKVNDKLYVDLRWLSHTLYQFKQLKLEDKYSRRWLFPATVTSVSRNRYKAKIASALMDGEYEISTRELQMWCYSSEADIPQPYTVLDDTFMRTHAYIRTLSLPENWDSLTDDQAAKLMDNYTT